MSQTLKEATIECEQLARSLCALTNVPGMPSNDALELRAHLASIILGDEDLAPILVAMVIEERYDQQCSALGYMPEVEGEEEGEEWGV